MKTGSGNTPSFFSPALLAVITLGCFGFTVYSIYAGYDAVFHNILYIPIILACSYYNKKGFLFSSLVCIIYLLFMAIAIHDIAHFESVLVRVVFFIVIAGVITILSLHRTRTGEALEEAETRYHSLFESMLEGFAYCRMILDENEKPIDFVYQKVNSAYEELTGLTRVEGRRGSEVYHELSSLHPELFHLYKRVIQTGQYEKKEITISPGDLRLSVSVYCPQKEYFLVVLTNITGKRKTEESLMESNNRIKRLMARLPVPLCFVTSDSSIEIMNSRFVQTFGYSHLELPTLFAFWERAFPDEMYRQWVKHTWENAVKRAKETGSDIEPAEYTITCKNGELRVVEISGIAIEEHILVTLVDFTDRRHAEEAVREANQKLRFLTGITRHDIFNQLNAMYLSLDMALDETDPEAIHDYVLRVQNAGKRIEAITGFTREYEHFGTESSGWQNINTIIDSAKTEIPTGIITITSNITSDLEVYADPIIRKVFTTLFDNAIRHGGKDISELTLSTHRNEDVLTIVCEDDGAGVAPSEKDLIFANGFGKNTGIGLFLSREILAINGLSIVETGVEGEGARFEIQVPAGKYRRMKAES